MHTSTIASRPSWRGIIAGLLIGLVVSMAMLLLALVLSSFLSLDLRGAGIAAGIYAVITALLSAFCAGYFAVKASAPEVIFGDGTAISPKDATLTGIITASCIIVITTFGALNGAASAIRTTSNAVSSTASALGGAASAIGGGAGSVAGAIGSAGTAAISSGMAASGIADGETLNNIKNLYNQATGEISRSDIEAIIAKNNDQFSQAQIAATAKVLEDIFNETKADAKAQMGALDFTDLQTWQNLDGYAKNYLNDIEAALTGDEFIVRLQNEGLDYDEAIQIREQAQTTYQEYKDKSEQKLAEARVAMDEAKIKAEQALVEAEAAARKAVLYTGLFGLISMLLTFVASIAGAKSAAANYRLSAPLIRRD